MGVGAHCGLPAGGAPQPSLHLTALVQLVKEIPGFLFGEVGPESRGASLDGEEPSPEGKSDNRVSLCHPQGEVQAVAAPCGLCRVPACCCQAQVEPPHPPLPAPCPAHSPFSSRPQLLRGSVPASPSLRAPSRL